MALYKLLGKAESKIEQKQIEQAQAQFTPEQLKFLQTVGTLFKENRIMSIHQIYEACGIPRDVVYSRNVEKIHEYIPFEKGTDADNVFKTYAYAVDKRYQLKNSPIIEHPNDVLNLNLHSKEKIYHVIYNVVFYQEKTTVTNITYSGLRWTSGPLRTGTLNVMTNESTHFAPVDAGNLIFTNERLIFIGKKNNVTKQVKISDILYNNMYQDGVVVHIPNRKPMLFKFPDYKDFGIYEISDGVNQFALVIERMRDGNYLDNLEEPIQQTKIEDRSSIVEALKSKNIDPLVAEIINKAKVGESIQVSTIQRNFEIGFAKAGKLRDQIEYLKLITQKENGIREWVVDGNDTKRIMEFIEAAKPYID